MADAFTERALRSQVDRHVGYARAVAKHIQEYAGYVLRDLDAGRIPGYHLVDDAVELEKRIAALDAIKDTTGIYDSETTP